MRLDEATLEALPGSVRRFSYDREAQEIGIVHLGLGAFHRAHQAVYTDRAMSAGDRDWAICGVSLRSSEARDKLAPQDGLYSVTERRGESASSSLIGALRTALVGTQDEAAVVAALSGAATRLATLTITEKGYCSAADGQLDFANPDVASDLSGIGPSRTIYGFAAAAFARRRAASLPGLTLLSCDNLANNGLRLTANIAQFLERTDPALFRWFEAECACPATMVDRIVPATTPRQIDALENTHGFRDEAAVFTEPFTQWVIEDRFAAARPRWEVAGAQFVSDVRPFEEAKLRMLNGAHSALAYIGLGEGHTYVHQAVADPTIRALIESLMLDEAAPTIPPTAGFDPRAYAAQLFERFENAALEHRLDQIAIDGSQKIPQRWLAVLRIQQNRGVTCPALLRAVAAWLTFMRDGEASDPLAERLAALWRREGPAGIVEAMFGGAGLFADEWVATDQDRSIIGSRISAELSAR